MTVFAAVALIASLFTKGYALDMALETEQRFVEKRTSEDLEKKGEKAAH
jgi:hypothetical protein